jgi:hypothetical protein
MDEQLFTELRAEQAYRRYRICLDCGRVRRSAPEARNG